MSEADTHNWVSPFHHDFLTLKDISFGSAAVLLSIGTPVVISHRT